MAGVRDLSSSRWHGMGDFNLCPMLSWAAKYSFLKGVFLYNSRPRYTLLVLFRIAFNLRSEKCILPLLWVADITRTMKYAQFHSLLQTV